jgi:hypothetical protein
MTRLQRLRWLKKYAPVGWNLARKLNEASLKRAEQRETRRDR